MGLDYLANKILLAKFCLDKFKKRLSIFYKQLLINKKCIYKDKFTNTFFINLIEQYVLKYEF